MSVFQYIFNESLNIPECFCISVGTVLPDTSLKITAPASELYSGEMFSVSSGDGKVCCDLKLTDGFFTGLLITVKRVFTAVVRKVRKMTWCMVQAVKPCSICRQPVCLRL